MNPEDDFLLGPTGAYAGPRTAGDVAYGTGATGLLFAPGAGVTDLMGYAPDPMQPGEYLPSFGENIREGNYLDAALQTLGGAGDVMMAGGAFVPPLVGVGAAMKAPRAARVAQSAPASIRAYHGSPHDFAPAVRVLDTETGKTHVQEAGDPILTGLMAQNPGKYEIIEENPLGMFDLSKMGTGEGAQAFGEGAYLSGAEDIARGYRDSLSPVSFSINGDRYDVPTADPIRGPVRAALEAKGLSGSEDIKRKAVNAVAVAASNNKSPLDVFRAEKEEVFEFLQRDIDEASGPEYRKGSIEFRDRLSSEYEEMEKFLEGLDIDIRPQTGKMYEAEIKVGPEELLDYDEFLYDQTPDIKKRIKNLVESELTEMDAVNLGYDTGKNVDLKSAKEFMLRDDMTIDEFLGNWQALRGSTDAGEFLLNKYGIPGLKYKAGGSRAPDMDEADIDRNYVIFDENMINILRKYGLLAPLVGGGTAAAVMGADEPQPAGGIL